MKTDWQPTGDKNVLFLPSVEAFKTVYHAIFMQPGQLLSQTSRHYKQYKWLYLSAEAVTNIPALQNVPAAL